ncbi:MAG: carbamoyltransferase [Melioribacteraceae bacterium]|nr:carbamoyltransferase [Melioribacteraceae bacterium]
MNILGISAYYHDSAAALICDGKIIAAAQEERFSRKKHDHRFPKNAIDFCLHEASISIEKIDIVAFYDKPFLKFERLLETYIAFAPIGIKSFIKAMPLWIKEKLWMKELIKNELKFDGKIIFPEHHESHAASAFFPSPFQSAAFLTIDGVGEWTTTSFGTGRGSKISIDSEIRFPHSIGLLYSAITYYTGFKVNSGEYKVMGLAPYGEPKYVDLILSELMDLKEDGSFKMNMKYFDYAAGLTMTNKNFDKLFGGEPRKPESKLTQREMDLARSVQDVTEEVMLRMARHIRKETGERNLVLAGGVALNCVANGKILKEKIFDDIWIQPAAGDAGGALGATLFAWYQYLGNPREISKTSSDSAPIESEKSLGNLLKHNDESILVKKSLTNGTPTSGEDKITIPEQDLKSSQSEIPVTVDARSLNSERYPDLQQGSYLGPDYSDDYIQIYLDSKVIPYYKSADREELINKTAELIASGKVIGWFQGKMEFGPRALGSRTIIGDPRSAKMQSIMNLKIKFRESFRPFAPSVLEERISDYFEIDRPSPYMLLVADVKKERQIPMNDDSEKLWGIDKLNIVRSDIPAVTHVDYSARIQSVNKNTNPLYHDLIAAFEKITGCGVIVNTSFNVRGEPIVNRPEEAFTCFMRTEMDYLVMGNFIINKEEQKSIEKDSDWKKEFELD